MAQPSEPVVRVAGIPVHIPLSGILGVLLLAYLWAPAFADGSGRSPWVMAVAFAVLLSVATLVHEFAHALTAQRLGYPVQRVVLQFLGGVTLFERRREAPLSEAAIAAAGPAATFAVAGLSYLLERALPAESVGAALASAMTWANLVIGIYNALPGLPLDGGNVLRCLVWAATGSERRGTVVAAWCGRAVAVATLGIPALLVAAGIMQADLLLFVVAGLLASMLWTGASAHLRAVELRSRASGISAVSLARRAMPVDRDLPLAEAIRRATAAGAGALVVVDARGIPTGVGQHDAIAAVPEQRRPWITVGSIARPVDATATIPGDLAGTDLLREVASRGREELLVLDPEGLVYGVLLMADVDAALKGQHPAGRR
ncbi:MAG TPA: site-2 protease family protein [Candidatus Nanopelagicales bacterium]